MECVTAVDKELDKVLHKFTGINEHTSQTLTDLINYVETIRQRLIEKSADPTLSTEESVAVTDCMIKIRNTISCIATEHRDLHSTVSKVGKAIDRNFTSDYGAASVISFFNGFQHHDLLNTVICEHFYRNGMLDISEDLATEAQLDLDTAKRKPFFELNCILEALMRKDLEPALQWVEKQREYLKSQQSLLEFKLHRLRFIELIRQGPEKQHEAILYARKSFQSLSSSHMNDLQSLMGSLLFVPQGIEKSPYSHLLDAANWTDICDVFTRDACSLLGLSVDSPLAVCINAGCAAFPALLNIKQAMLQRKVPGVWNSKDELPIEVELGKHSRYHSVFACPILRQPSTDSNPPMRLSCGHVISKDALNKLTTGNRYAKKLKCPYCPIEQSPTDAQRIHF